MKRMVLAGLLVLCLAMVAQAGVITVESSNSIYAPNKVLWGMPEGDMTHAIPSTGWLSEHTGRGYNGVPYIIFDLTEGAAELRHFDSVAITAHDLGWTASQVQILYSTDDSWYGPGRSELGGTMNLAGFVNAGTFDVSTTGTTLINIDADAQWVNIIVTKDSSGHATPVDHFLGYRSADFTTSDVVPEPATLSLLGLGLVGLISRRRK